MSMQHEYAKLMEIRTERLTERLHFFSNGHPVRFKEKEEKKSFRQ
jgi:hypothetical protein